MNFNRLTLKWETLEEVRQQGKYVRDAREEVRRGSWVMLATLRYLGLGLGRVRTRVVMLSTAAESTKPVLALRAETVGKRAGVNA